MTQVTDDRLRTGPQRPPYGDVIMKPHLPSASLIRSNLLPFLLLTVLPAAVVAAMHSSARGQTAGKPAPTDLANGKALYAKTCVTCHGDRAQGKKEVLSPALHRQEDWYLVAQLAKFRAGHRGTDPKDVQGALMRPMALSLPSDQAVQDVAAYISSIDGPAAVAEVKGDLAAGKAAFAKVCAACHGENALGKPELKTPALVGQNDWYVVAQLQKFRAGQRGADPKDITGAQMRAIALSLTNDQAVRDVAAFIATLK